MTDLSKTIAPSSEQLNADDLLSAPLTIRITQVRGRDDKQQPIAINFEGDEDKPYLPCKSMRRVLVNTWGADGKSYVGRSLTLYRDENVTYGNIKVGGLRISHMSHISEPVTLALTTTRAKRTPYTVKPLKAPAATASQQRVTPPPEPPSEPALEVTESVTDMAISEMTPDQVKAWAESFRAMVIKNGKTTAGMMELWNAEFDGHLVPMREGYPELFASVESWFGGRLKRFREQEAVEVGLRDEKHQ